MSDNDSIENDEYVTLIEECDEIEEDIETKPELDLESDNDVEAELVEYEYDPEGVESDDGLIMEDKHYEVIDYEDESIWNNISEPSTSTATLKPFTINRNEYNKAFEDYLEGAGSSNSNELIYPLFDDLPRKSEKLVKTERQSAQKAVQEPEIEDLFHCSSCNVKFATSVEDHIEQFHKDQTVLVDRDPVSDNEIEEELIDNPLKDEEIIEMYEEVEDDEPTPFFCCNKCQKRYITSDELITHIAVAHSRNYKNSSDDDVKPYSCNLCDSKFHLCRQLTSHMKAIHNTPPAMYKDPVPRKCKVCNYFLPSLKALKEHMLEHCQRKPEFGCLESIKDMTENAANSGDELPYLCLRCPGKFAELKELTKHYTDEHDVKQSPAKKIRQIKKPKETTGNEQQFSQIIYQTNRRQIKSEQKINVVKKAERKTCPICNTHNLKNLTLHMRIHDPVLKVKTVDDILNSSQDVIDEPKAVCDLCNKSFHKRLLKAHMKSHINPNEFTCKICNKDFDSEQHLGLHIKVHEKPSKQTRAEIAGVKLPHACQYCGREFLRPHEKVKHERIHTGEKPYECEVCGKKFRVSYSLTLHLRTHTQMRPYVCSICHKRYKSYAVYSIHLLTHSDERPYKCPHCPKAFKTPNQWIGHKNSHLKPYNCPECNRPFSSMYAVKKHMKTHNKSNKSNSNLKHSCSICGAVYARLFALRFHMKESHDTELDEDVELAAAAEESESNALIVQDVHDPAVYMNEDEISTQAILQEEIVMDTTFHSEEVVTDWLVK